MSDPARVLTCIITALTVASCIHGEPVDLDRNPWTPPPGNVVDTDSESVITGRLWVIPNPILFRPDHMEVKVDITSIGTESTSIQDVRFAADGSPEVSIFLTHGAESGAFSASAGLGGTAPPLPLDLEYRLDCGGGPGMGFPFSHDYTGGDMTPGYLIVVTDDPTSPSLKVPIGYDLSGSHTHDDPVDEQDILIDVRPNPVRFTRGRAEIKDLCVNVQHTDEAFALDDVRIHGEGLSLVEPVDLSVPLEHPSPGGFGIEYAPTTDDDVNGALIVDFTDNWGDEETLVVPILVR
jgi:hypothetical protein